MKHKTNVQLTCDWHQSVITLTDLMVTTTNLVQRRWSTFCFLTSSESINPESLLISVMLPTSLATLVLFYTFGWFMMFYQIHIRRCMQCTRDKTLKCDMSIKLSGDGDRLCSTSKPSHALTQTSIYSFGTVSKQNPLVTIPGYNRTIKALWWWLDSL